MSRSRASRRQRSLLRWAVLPWLFGAVGLGVGAACSAGGGSDLGGGTTTGQGGNWFDGGTGGSGFDWDAACLKASNEATEVPVSLLLMFDKSGSMLGPKWSQSTAALQAFFSDPACAGLRVGLRFFPDTGCDENCDEAPCAVPKVEPAPLTDLSAPTDTQEQALLDAFVGVSPGGGTPMSTALQGGLDWATTYLGSHPFEKAAVVLVTDGDPQNCDMNVSNISAEAQAAYSSHGVLTFVIGLPGSTESTINHIAQAGGTGQGIFIVSDNAQAELVAALNHIRGSTVACEYLVPSEVNGQPVDPDLVNVVYTPGGGGDPVLIGQVQGKEACTPDKGGWYYDNPVAPTRLTFCESTCTAMQAEPGAKVDILIGCSTIPV